MKIKKLECSVISNVGGGYYADIKPFGTGYAIEWCQQDFENRIKALIEL